MKTAFADTMYWVAILMPKDQWASSAKSARESLGDVQLLTTDEVLTEFLALANSRENLRRQAAKLVRSIFDDPEIEIIPQSRDSFLQGLELFERRPDKEYSLTDCISMNVMRENGVTQVLTNDHHFAQEGFTILMASPK